MLAAVVPAVGGAASSEYFTWPFGAISTQQYLSPGDAAAAGVAYCTSVPATTACGGNSTSRNFAVQSLTVGTWPAYTWVFSYTFGPGAGTNTTTSGSLGAGPLAIQPSCSASGTKEDVYTQASVSGPVCGNDACLYEASNPTYIVNSPPGAHYLTTVTSMGQGANTGAASTCSAGVGQQESVSNAPNVASSGSCQTGSTGVVACDAQQSVGPGCGTFNGDQVCVTGIPSGSCVAYASGGVACVSTALAEPSGPAPNNGTASVPAAPNGQVTYNTTTVNYYTASTVLASSGSPSTTNPVSGGPADGSGASGNVNVENFPSTQNVAGSVSVSNFPSTQAVSGTVAVSGVSGTVTVQGSGSGGSIATTNHDAAADGDCSAGSCTGTVPGSLDVSGLSYAGVIGTFFAAVQAAPIPSGVTALESAWPTGSCDVGSVSLAMPDGTTTAVDYGTTFCSVWSGYVASPLATASLVVWALIAVFILLSA